MAKIDWLHKKNSSSTTVNMSTTSRKRNRKEHFYAKKFLVDLGLDEDAIDRILI